MDETTSLAAQAIIRAVHSDAATVANIVRELHSAAVVATGTIGRAEAVQIMVLANSIEINAEVGV